MAYRKVRSRPAITQERLREVLHYDPDTGQFTWLKCLSSRGPVGTAAGHVSAASGYRQITIDGSKYYAHRLAWLYMTGKWPSPECDHRNGVRDNNRWTNLREATKAQSAQNRRVRSDNKSGHAGVAWVPLSSRWRAKITVKGKRTHLGHFDLIEDAIAAYAKAKAEMHPFQPVARAQSGSSTVSQLHGGRDRRG